MFGGKKQSETVAADAADDEATHEYLAVAYLGINAFNQGVNALARKGWELINGCMAGTAHYAYMRRPLRRDVDQPADMSVP